MNKLVVDVGNTSTAVGLARGARIERVRHVPSHGLGAAAVDALLAGVARGVRLDGAILGSVVPALNRRWLAALKRAGAAAPLLLTHRLALGVAIDYPKPARIGADRLANASGAVARFGAPAIVADFGTALTFDVVSRAGAYIGGVIVPGLPFMTDYLAEKTALLPHIEPRGLSARVGRSTRGAMRIGAQVGYRGMVREIVEHLRAGNDLDGVTLCATGGYARWVLRGLRLPFRFDPNLTLFGMSRIFDLNATGGR